MLCESFFVWCCLLRVQQRNQYWWKQRWRLDPASLQLWAPQQQQQQQQPVWGSQEQPQH
jgi:hypothetical protein